MTSKQFDLVILGAGTAGCLAAHTAVKSGLEKVAIIDRKPEKLIGNKICGDGIGINHLENLQKLGFPIKEGNVIANQLQTARLISPDKEKSVENEVKKIDAGKTENEKVEEVIEEAKEDE